MGKTIENIEIEWNYFVLFHIVFYNPEEKNPAKTGMNVIVDKFFATPLSPLLARTKSTILVSRFYFLKQPR